MTLSEFIITGKAKIMKAGLQCADPLLHMKQIAEFGLGMTTTKLYLRWDDTLTAIEEKRLEGLLERRLTGEPFQYIAGEEWFWDSRFQVGPGVLIPRRETELIVETLLTRETREKLRIAELGAGSGNIGISIVLERPSWEWHAFELNPETLPYSRTNKERLLPREASYFLHEGDFFSEAPNFAPFDWIVSNPPYIGRREVLGLSKEVRHEPPLALVGGERGLEVIEKLVALSERLLSAGGGFLCEIGADQGQAVREFFNRKGFGPAEILLDYAGLPRAVVARKEG